LTKIRRPATGNLTSEVPSALDEEAFTELASSGAVRILRIVSTGQTTAWQEAEDEEWVLVLTGRGTLHFEDGDRRVSLGPGDWCHIPAGVRHRVAETDPERPTVWLAVHFPAPDASDAEDRP
jgi:cupin 2 domain-containing protein